MWLAKITKRPKSKGNTVSDIQQQIINSAMIRPEHLFILMRYPVDIFTGQNVESYNVLKSIYDEGLLPDLPAFIQKAERLKAKININDYVLKVMGMPALNNIEMHLDALQEKFYLNKVKYNSKDLYNALERGDMGYEVFIENILAMRDKEVKNTSGGVEASEIAKLDLEDAFPEGVFHPTNITPVDDKLFGLVKGNTHIIASRPGVGKTTLALWIAMHSTKHVQFFSLEMKMRELYSKMLSAYSGIEHRNILAQRLTKEEIKTVNYARSEVAKLNITFFDNGDNISEMNSKIITYKKLKDTGLLIVDYVQLVSGGKGHTKNEEMTDISRTIKKTTMKLDFPTIILSQLNREVEKTSRTPMLSDLRDSGSLEQDASLVIFLHEKKRQKNEDPIYHCIIGKNRMGPVGKISGLYHEKKYSRFGEKEIAEPVYDEDM